MERNLVPTEPTIKNINYEVDDDNDVHTFLDRSIY